MKTMRSRSALTVIVCVLSVGGFAVLGIATPESYGGTLSPLVAAITYRTLLGIAAGMAVVQFGVATRRDFWYATGLQVGTFLACVSFFHMTVGAILLFGAVLVIQPAIYEQFPLNLAAAYGIVVVASLALFVDDTVSIQDRIVFAAVLCMLGSFASLMTRYREAMIPVIEYNDKLEDNVTVLSRANYMLQDFNKNIAAASRRAERQRVTRDIHDAVGYVLTNNLMMLEAIKLMAVSHPERIADHVEKIKQNTERGLKEIKNALHGIRSEEFSRESFFVVLKRLATVFSVSTGVNVRIEYGNTRGSSLEFHADTIYHFVQEGLINAFRHGRASEVLVTFWSHGEKVEIVMTDNGVGLPPKVKEGIGTTGMKERVENARGRFSFGPGAIGVELRAILPIGSGAEKESITDDSVDTLAGEANAAEAGIV